MMSDEESLTRTVKEFGNGAHVTLPREHLGEEVTIVVKERSEPTANLEQPVSTEDLKSVFSRLTKSDFTIKSSSDSRSSHVKNYQYESDVRLSVDVDRKMEDDPSRLYRLEENTVRSPVVEPTSEELGEHAEWYEPGDEIEAEFVAAINPQVEDVIGGTKPNHGDWYQFTVQWDGTAVREVSYQKRPLANGMAYVPSFGYYNSLEEYRGTLEYYLAVAVSSLPQEEYDLYLDTLDPCSDDETEVSRREKLQQTLYWPQHLE